MLQNYQISDDIGSMEEKNYSSAKVPDQSKAAGSKIEIQ